MPLNAHQRQTLLWTGIAAVISAAILALGPVLSPFVAAAIVSYVLEPGVRWLRRHGIPRTLAVLIMLLLAVGALVGIGGVLIPIVHEEFVLIRTQLPGLAASISERFVPWVNERFDVTLAWSPASVRDWFARHIASSGEDWAAALWAYTRSGSSAALQVMGFIFIVPVLTFYLLSDWHRLLMRIRTMVPARWLERVDGLAHEIDHLLGQYLRGQILVVVALACYYSVALLVAGFRLWLPIGVLTGMLIAIPYVGFGMGLVFALIAAMLQFGISKGLVVIAIVYGLGQALEGFYVTPKLVGERIGLPPLAVILALMVFGSVFGFVGVLLALPLSAVLVVALRRLQHAYLDSEFYRRSE
jgi:predicted PurR-regulated permease PerM